jgi:hypothetical protein
MRDFWRGRLVRPSRTVKLSSWLGSGPTVPTSEEGSTRAVKLEGFLAVLFVKSALPARSWATRCAHFRDPDGQVWEIHKRLGGR